MPTIHPPPPSRPAPRRRTLLALLIALVLATVLLVAPAIARAVLAEDTGGDGSPPATAPGAPATLPPG